MERIRTLDIDRWQPDVAQGERQSTSLALEAGQVIHMPHLGFELLESERRFLTPQWSDGKSKNISLEGEARTLKGVEASEADRAALGAMLARFAQNATALVTALCPRYAPHIHVARTSFRPFAVTARQVSWRKDDSRLHVDAFPSRPNRGLRILRVFSNVNPHGEPRVWRVGEPFEAMARHFMPRVGRPLPGQAALFAALGITKSRRSEYDHIMLRLHDLAKADLDYQRNCAQETVPFPPGSTWMVFSDQAMHAAMSGAFMFEQTIHLPLEALETPETAPLRVLERIAGRALV